jgi:D-aminoacyl-tRNA deacylase
MGPVPFITRGGKVKAVIQRVLRASVEVDSRIVGQIDGGMLVLLGVAKGDGEVDVQYMVEKLTTLRMFSDNRGKMNLALSDVAGAVLLVSQFTLLADTRNGRRPGFDAAAPPDAARRLYDLVAEGVRRRGITVETGQFGAHMCVLLQNDGPVTFLVDSRP